MVKTTIKWVLGAASSVLLAGATGCKGDTSEPSVVAGVPQLSGESLTGCGTASKPRNESVRTWLSGADVVVEGRVAGIGLGFTPFTYHQTTRPEIGESREECGGTLQPAFVVELDEIDVLKGELQRQNGAIRLQVGAALTGNWSPVPTGDVDDSNVDWFNVEAPREAQGAPIVPGQRLFLALRVRGDELGLWGDVLAAPVGEDGVRYLADYCVTDEVRNLSYRELVEATRAVGNQQRSQEAPAFELDDRDWVNLRGAICHLESPVQPGPCLTDGSCRPADGRRMRCVDGRCEPAGEVVELIEGGESQANPPSR